VLRIDSAGASHELLDWCRDARIRYSVGYDLTETVRAAILEIPDSAWVCALDQDGSERPNGQVAEITGLLDLGDWPVGSRVIVRRERAHPGRAAHVHRPRRAPLPSDPHRPARRHRRDRA
jgi:DDE family transposase